MSDLTALHSDFMAWMDRRTARGWPSDDAQRFAHCVSCELGLVALNDGDVPASLRGQLAAAVDDLRAALAPDQDQ